MPFVVDDFRDFIQLLDQHPEWRAELRRHVLSDELLELPTVLREVVDGLAQLTARVNDQAVQMAQLTARVNDQAVQMAQLTARVNELAARMNELAARMDELAARMDDLASRMTELTMRVDRLTARMDDLVAELILLGAHVDGLVRSQQALRQEVGSLSELAGAQVEVDAQNVLAGVLRTKGYEPLGRPEPLDLGMEGEVDVAMPVRDAAGGHFWLLLEAKARLHRGDVLGWERRLQETGFQTKLKAAGVTDPLLPYAFGLRVYRGAREQGRESGIGIMDPEGELEEAVPRSA